MKDWRVKQNDIRIRDLMRVVRSDSASVELANLDRDLKNVV